MYTSIGCQNYMSIVERDVRGLELTFGRIGGD
jgi:hypothetical protein